MKKESSLLEGKNILLGISGGIASYKVAQWVRSLTLVGAEVHVVMTEAAARFVSPMTFAALSGNPVHSDMFSLSGAEQIPHIKLAKNADLVLIAPATANTIARLAHGLADDLLSTAILATRAKVLVCPAMNNNMYCHAATRNNIQILKEHNHTVIEPTTGALACGDEGQGRLPDWEVVQHTVLSALSKQDLQDRTIVITAGPTREMIDPVRFISNRSSGRMGHALAATASRRGGMVTLISGPTSLPDPPGVSCISVTSAEQMRQEVMKHAPAASIIVKAAAVSDYRPIKTAPHKIKKDAATYSLDMTQCDDILKELGDLKKKNPCFPLLVGFAAESENHVAEGRRKLSEKNLDLIVVNDILAKDAGFESETNRVIIIDRDNNQTQLPLLSKEEAADHIWNNIVRLLAD